MKLGIVAAGGNLPVRLAEHCAKKNLAYHVFPITGHATPELYQGHPFDDFRLGAGGTFIRNLHHRHITDLVLIGFISRPTLSQLRPDLFTLFRILPKLRLSQRGDDGVLRALASLLERYGRVNIRGIHEFLPELLAPEGTVTDLEPSNELSHSIRHGIDAALDLGKADIGQAVIAGTDKIYTSEDSAGTDALMRRFSHMEHDGDAVLVKLCKPQQDMRIDMPTIGLRTIENAAAAGIKGIVVSAGKTLIDDKERVIAKANSEGLFLQGVNVP